MFNAFISAIITAVMLGVLLYDPLKRAWRYYRFKKAKDAYFKCINDYFANLPPREPQLCKDCKHAEFSTNNGNLICLDGKSSYFGTAVNPEGDVHSLCFARKE